MVDGGPEVRERCLVATLQIPEKHINCREAGHGSQILGSSESHIQSTFLLAGQNLPLTGGGDSFLVLLPLRGMFLLIKIRYFDLKRLHKAS